MDYNSVVLTTIDIYKMTYIYVCHAIFETIAIFQLKGRFCKAAGVCGRQQVPNFNNKSSNISN